MVDPSDPSGLIVVPPVTEVSPLTDAPVNGEATAERVATARLNTSVKKPTNANEAFLNLQDPIDERLGGNSQRRLLARRSFGRSLGAICGA